MRITLTMVVVWVILALSSAQPYVTIVIDPGHGGPGASQFGPNGDGAGTAGPEPQPMSEQWVNLQVGQRLATIIDNDWLSAMALLTRDEETQFLELWDRVQIAKDNWADYFVSVHHGGHDEPSTQFSEVFWSNRSEAVWGDSGDPDSTFIRSSESRDSLLAKKVLLRIHAAWKYTDHCTRPTNDWHMRDCDEAEPSVGDLFILGHSHSCRCALSEASPITNALEEYLFLNDYFTNHITSEANAIYSGMKSHRENSGIAEISNRYLGAAGSTVAVDEEEFTSPVEFTWRVGELHSLEAWSNFYLGGRTYTFHHWAHLTPGSGVPLEERDLPNWSITVPWEDGLHIYRAYFTGGLYGADIAPQPDPQRYAAGDTALFQWSANPGVDSTTVVSLYLDRNNGAGGYPELLGLDVPIKERGYLDWVVSGTACDFCRLKVVAHDIAGNQTTEEAESWNTFSICTWKVGDADGSAAINISDAVYLIDHIFGPCEGCPSGPPPTPHNPGSGDADCSGSLSISDAVYLINYFFAGGLPPGEVCSCADYE